MPAAFDCDTIQITLAETFLGQLLNYLASKIQIQGFTAADINAALPDFITNLLKPQDVFIKRSCVCTISFDSEKSPKSAGVMDFSS